MPELVEIEKLAWPDVKAKLDSGYQTAVFSVGATEQHGPHLPLIVDTLLGTEVAVRVAQELGGALVAPTVRPGNSHHHLGFAGTIALKPTTIIAIIVDYCNSLAQHGFREIVVISSHGGNAAVVRTGAQEAQWALGPDFDVIAITNLLGYVDLPEYKGAEDGFHATRLETSCVLRLVPELVHMERARDWVNPIDPKIKDVGNLLDRHGVIHFAADGTMGNPTTAEAEYGERGLANMAHNVAEQVRIIRQHRRQAVRA